MEKIQILSIGRDPLLLKKLSSFINENPKWESIATVDDETAIEVFHQRKFDIVLLIDQIEAESDKKIRSLFSFNNPDLIFINHVGGSTGILANEIQEALDKRKNHVNIMDDIFKNKKEE
jgi:cellobiose-specific phosphotransferase system component IIB